MGYFDERRVTQVDVYGITYEGGEDSGFSVNVALGVSSIDGSNLGPAATINLFIPSDRKASLDAIQEEAVDRAVDLMRRIVSEDREAMKQLLYAAPDIDLRKR
ncbi:MAG: hypothetical protein Q4G14_05930 [Paracoccus sp. (in: a-proteobacteria)]|uniref:hypothetical protein n=1 Tax=Paracoccus sp. TaxID=267 RepID=UPI0026DFB6C3|nr:hypothetical protein [Paracoccus sp. (in: a-proteobacteria)]MDO5612768.1 hypothetical protein [Paracoccus sp. (in: a-proteobacteria)]